MVGGYNGAMRAMLPACVALLTLTGFCPVEAPCSMAGGMAPAPAVELAPLIVVADDALPESASEATLSDESLSVAPADAVTAVVPAQSWIDAPALAKMPAPAEKSRSANDDETLGLPLNPRLTLTGEAEGLMRLFENSRLFDGNSQTQQQTPNRQPVRMGLGLRYRF